MGLLLTQSLTRKTRDRPAKPALFTPPLVSFVTAPERFKFGVIRHALAQQPLPDGSILGVFLHLGSESTGISETRVSDEKIRAMYGAFPDWKIPE